MALHQTRMLFDIGLVGFQFLYLGHYFGEDVGDGLMIVTADAVQEGMTGFDVEFDCGDPRAVLSPVVLFFHQQIQLVQAPKNGAVLLQVIGERLTQTDECQAAFMFYFIAHGPQSYQLPATKNVKIG